MQHNFVQDHKKDLINRGICIKHFYGDFYSDKILRNILYKIIYIIRFDAKLAGDIIII